MIEKNIDDLISTIKYEIENSSYESKYFQEGVVTSCADGVATIYGLFDAMYSEVIKFSSGAVGIVFSIFYDSIGCVILNGVVKEGDKAYRTESVINVPVGENLLGRIINPLGNPLDKLGEIKSTSFRPIENEAPSILDREPVNQPLQTGIKAIDSMIPIGRGQRELIIGDRGTGKTAIAIDTILNQKDSNVFCIYVAIGQKSSTVAGIVEVLKKKGVLDYTVIVFSGASDSPAMQYIAPYSGCAIAEEFMYSGKDVLIVYDDLSKHAIAYRQLSLLLRRPPGREAYPGDIFYIHSRLLERSAKLAKHLGGGSMTALPIVETQAGDISSYIPTNIISITDGQIFLETDLFNSDIKPAINVGLSVSRVGGAAQLPAMRNVAANLRLNLAQYRELLAFSQFSSEVDESTKQKILRGKKLTELLKQDQYEPMPVSDQIIILFAGVRGYFDDVNDSDINRFQKGLISYVKNNYSSLTNELKKGSSLTEDIKKQLSIAITSYKSMFFAKDM